MDSTPRALRLHIGFFGRTNAGKSTLFNLFSGQDVSLISPVPGTTTDPVEKAMELYPVGPVQLIDTAGFFDAGILGRARESRSRKVLERTDLALLVLREWGEVESEILAALKEAKIPTILVVNGAEVSDLPENLPVLRVNAADPGSRDRFLTEFKAAALPLLPEDFVTPPPVARQLVKPGDLVMLIVPIDIQAPRGRLILPQVQVIRDLLDGDSTCLVVKENRYAETLAKLKNLPDLVICDSQVVKFMIEQTPPEVPCTTFSILMAALKGDIAKLFAGAKKIFELKDGDQVLIAESCTHHATCEDIGRVKIPRLLARASGAKLKFTVVSGHDFPENLADFALIVHCGSCMFSRREFLARLARAELADVPITNYGMAISACTQVLDRVIAPLVTEK